MIHPALLQLLRFQSLAKLRRLGRSFSTPRKRFFACAAVGLAALWLGNAAWSVVAREPLSPGTLQSSIPAVLLCYALWHLVKAAYRRPDQGIEWTPAEQELICARPFRRRDLLAYRFASIAAPGLLKAGCFVLLMLPDLRLPWIAFLGTFLALIFLDLWRMAIEITACGVSELWYARLRAVVLLLTSAALGCVLTMTVNSSGPTSDNSQFGLAVRLLSQASQLRHTWFGTLAETPFRIFSQVMTAEDFSLQSMGWVLLATSLVMAAAWLVIRLDQRMHRLSMEREQLRYCQTRQAKVEFSRIGDDRVRLTRIPRLGGVGPIAWRQFVGAGEYLGSLLLALAPPGILSCLPLLVIHDPSQATVNVIGALTFYSFLLLPSALKFDFRRDVDRLFILKGLPVPPWAVVVGQLVTPVFIASGLQVVVITVTFLIWPVQFHILAVALGLLFPLNVLIYALENLFFLCYPYRLKQEGVEVFLRATLTFSAKGLLFALGLGAVFAWAILSQLLARATGIAAGWSGGGPILFVAGLWGILTLSSIAAVHQLVAAYQRFDPCQDAPG